MFLEYGVNDRGELVYIDAVRRGRTSLTCPYCGVQLVAKKGAIKVPHFAHDGSTCAPSVSGRASLPAFDKFDLQLPLRVLAQLRRFASGHTHGVQLGTLRDYALIEKNDKGGFELTKRGKIPLGQLPLDLFLDYQEAAFLDRHRELEDQVRETSASDLTDSQQAAERHMRLTDLRLYRAQWGRLLQSTLYFIEVSHASDNWPSPFYKIGITTRDLAVRYAEIERDLRPHLGAVTLTPLEAWPHRGSVEFYFKHRYQKQQYRIERLTEYFQFRNLDRVFTSDLRQIPLKTLSLFEQALINGAPVALEQEPVTEDTCSPAPKPLSS
jgi:hypothetical protein